MILNYLTLKAFFILFALNVNAQTNTPDNGPPELLYYYFNFDGNDEEMLEFDTTGIWQVGIPDKEEWDTALNGTHVLMTDTANLLNKPAKASVIFKWERPWWSNCVMVWSISAKHKYEFPFGKAGGYVEVSYDKGNNWVNVVNDTTMNNNLTYAHFFDDTLENGENAATGEKSEWGGGDYFLSQKQFYPDSIAALVYSIWIRLVYQNLDTIAHKGWMIDSLKIRIGHNCEFLSVEELENSKIKLYPNPLTNESVLEFPNPNNEEFKFKAFDIIGRMVLQQSIFNEKLILNRSDFDNGYYLYRLSNGIDKIYTGKFIVE